MLLHIFRPHEFDAKHAWRVGEPSQFSSQCAAELSLGSPGALAFEAAPSGRTPEFSAVALPRALELSASVAPRAALAPAPLSLSQSNRQRRRKRIYFAGVRAGSNLKEALDAPPGLQVPAHASSDTAVAEAAAPGFVGFASQKYRRLDWPRGRRRAVSRAGAFTSVDQFYSGTDTFGAYLGGDKAFCNVAVHATLTDPSPHPPPCVKLDSMTSNAAKPINRKCDNDVSVNSESHNEATQKGVSCGVAGGAETSGAAHASVSATGFAGFPRLKNQRCASKSELHQLISARASGDTDSEVSSACEEPDQRQVYESLFLAFDDIAFTYSCAIETLAQPSPEVAAMYESLNDARTLAWMASVGGEPPANGKPRRFRHRLELLQSSDTAVRRAQDASHILDRENLEVPTL